MTAPTVGWLMTLVNNAIETGIRCGYNSSTLADRQREIIAYAQALAATPPQPAREVRMLTAEEISSAYGLSRESLPVAVQRKFAEVNGLTLATPQGEQQNG